MQTAGVQISVSQLSGVKVEYVLMCLRFGYKRKYKQDVTNLSCVFFLSGVYKCLYHSARLGWMPGRRRSSPVCRYQQHGPLPPVILELATVIINISKRSGCSFYAQLLAAALDLPHPHQVMQWHCSPRLATALQLNMLFSGFHGNTLSTFASSQLI